MKGLPPLPPPKPWNEQINNKIDDWDSVSELARTVGLSRSTINFYREGKRIPTAPNLLRLVKVLWPSQMWMSKLFELSQLIEEQQDGNSLEG
jgi:transcriptional regulator with XRE-family HTH domain